MNKYQVYPETLHALQKVDSTIHSSHTKFDLLSLIHSVLGKLRKYKVLMAPRRLSVCDVVLEQEGVIGSLTIEDLPIDLIPVDEDLLSLEQPQLLNSLFMVFICLSVTKILLH